MIELKTHLTVSNCSSLLFQHSIEGRLQLSDGVQAQVDGGESSGIGRHRGGVDVQVRGFLQQQCQGSVGSPEIADNPLGLRHNTQAPGVSKDGSNQKAESMHHAPAPID